MKRRVDYVIPKEGLACPHAKRVLMAFINVIRKEGLVFTKEYRKVNVIPKEKLAVYRPSLILV